jgi:hypothetical protein
MAICRENVRDTYTSHIYSGSLCSNRAATQNRTSGTTAARATRSGGMPITAQRSTPTTTTTQRLRSRSETPSAVRNTGAEQKADVAQHQPIGLMACLAPRWIVLARRRTKQEPHTRNHASHKNAYHRSAVQSAVPEAGITPVTTSTPPSVNRPP